MRRTILTFIISIILQFSAFAQNPAPDSVKVTFAGKSSGIFSKETIVRSQKLKTNYTEYSIESFYLSSDRNVSLSIFNNTCNFNDEIKSYFTKAVPGEKLKFESIRLIDKNGKRYFAPDIIITIK